MKVKKNDEKSLSLREPAFQPFGPSYIDPFGIFFPSREYLHPIPAIDISEDEKQITIEADLPGYKPEDMNVEINGRTLIIRGKTIKEHEEKNKQYHKRERMSGTFERRFTLPDNIDTEKISCEMQNGVLCITAPKVNDGQKTKKIEIRKSK